MQERYFTITKQNSELNTSSGLWNVYYPSEFVCSDEPIKYIEVLNFLYFNESGQVDIGTSAHASFNMDAVENSQMICFSSPTATTSFTV